jgi:hypothetical protein
MRGISAIFIRSNWSFLLLRMGTGKPLQELVLVQPRPSRGELDQLLVRETLRGESWLSRNTNDVTNLVQAPGYDFCQLDEYTTAAACNAMQAMLVPCHPRLTFLSRNETFPSPLLRYITDCC